MNENERFCIGGHFDGQRMPDSTLNSRSFRVPGSLKFDRYHKAVVPHPDYGDVPVWVHENRIYPAAELDA